MCGYSSFLSYNACMTAQKELNQDFFKTWSPEMAYVFGFFTADGSMIRNKRGGCYIEFTSTDRDVLESIQKVTQSTHKLQKRPLRNAAWNEQYRIQIGSKEWHTDLLKLGLTQNKSKTLSFPEIPKSYFGDFARGYFDGDGCVYFKQHFSKQKKKDIWVFTTLFTSGSRTFLESLHIKLLESCVKGGHISGDKTGYDLVFSRHDSLALHRLMYHTVGVSNMFLSRKREKLERAIKVLGLDK